MNMDISKETVAILNKNRKGVKTMNFQFIGIGAGGNKAVLNLINDGICDEMDAILVNSTDKDIPKEFNGDVVILSPDNAGCGKERKIAKDLAVSSMKAGQFDRLLRADTDSVLIVTSVEGGTGSGSTPIIAKYINKVLGKIVHIVAFTGFEEDVRGIENTVEFFQEIDFEADVMVIRNSAFLEDTNGNKLRAEELADKELSKRLRVMLGLDLVDSTQIIDDTDLYKLVSTTGYKTIEKIEFTKNLMNVDEFNTLCKKMIYTSKSIKSLDPGEMRLGVILNIRQESEDAIDHSFNVIKEEYGNPYELFTHIQYDSKQPQYIAFISSGMKMPVDEVKAIYDRYLEETSKVDKANDEFFNTVKGLNIKEEDSMFNMVNRNRNNTSKDDFFDSL